MRAADLTDCALVALCLSLVRVLVQVAIYRRLLIGRDGHLDQSEAYDISQLVRKYGPSQVSNMKLNVWSDITRRLISDGLYSVPWWPYG